MTTPISSVTGATGATGASQPSTIRQAAEGFEGMFMSMLVDEMFKDTEIAQANPVYGGLMTEKLGDQLAQDGGIGLADVLERQLGGAPSTGSAAG
jgi:Rod binding domain-containing protein